MSENTKIRFLFDTDNIGERLKWKDIKKIRKFGRMAAKGEDIDDGLLEQLQISACRFMADENGQYLPPEEAYAVFDELSRNEAIDVITKFSKTFKEATIPNAKEGQSNSTSEASSLTPPTSPTGSPS